VLEGGQLSQVGVVLESLLGLVVEDILLLPLEDVQGGAPQLLGPEGLYEGRQVNDLAPAGVDQYHVLLHFVECFLVDEVVGLREKRNMNSDEV